MSALNRIAYLDTTAADQALALKMYSGIFQEAWRQSTYLWDNSIGVIARQTVDSGKSFQFLQMADSPPAEEFTPGDEMLGQAYAVAEGTITVDGYLVAHKAVPRDQMKIGHFDILPKLAKGNARVIGQRYDKRLFSLACQAARASASTKNGLTVHNGGNRVTRTGGAVATAYPASATGAANLRADLRTLARRMDEDNIPNGKGQRLLWLRPDMREVLLYDTTAQVFSFDYQSGNDISARTLVNLEGFEIVDFPNTVTNGGPFPDSNVTTDAFSKYNANFSIGASNGTPVALALCSGPDSQAAVGVVTFESVQHVVKYVEEKLSWLVFSFVLVGAGQLSPYCAGSVEVIT